MWFWFWWAVIAVGTGCFAFEAWAMDWPFREKVYFVAVGAAALMVTATVWSVGGVWQGP